MRLKKTGSGSVPDAARKYRYSWEKFISSFLCSYFIVSVLNLLLHINDEIYFTSLGFMQKDRDGSDFIIYCIFIVILLLLLTVAEIALPKYNIVPNILVISALMLAFLLMYKSDLTHYYMYFAVLFGISLVLLYGTQKKCLHFIPSEFHGAIMWSAVGAIALVFGFYIAATGAYRYLTYSAPNFDFGIFCNMFYNMKETGFPNVTSERDMLLSHFAVHFSPIYYIMLPFYYVFPSPITLQIFQAVVVYSGIIPLVLIARNNGISQKLTVVISAVYAAYPAISAGCFYDLHENCFLLPLLLWVFYFFEKKKYIPMAVFSLLVLLVKEDAFIYLLVFALFIIISEKQWKIGLPLAAISLVYFLVVSSLMEAYGLGIMSNRFGNMIFNSEDGLIGVIKTILLNPGYTLSQIFTTSTNNTDKLKYLIELLVPLAFLPFATKKISRIILLSPILLNILTMYKYQPDITFQYSFGITAFLFYLVILNLSELKPFSRDYMISIAAVAAILMFTIVVIPKYGVYVERYETQDEIYKRMDYALEEVLPKDASVACSSFILSHIAQRDVVYEVNYHKENGKYKADTEYIVLDMRTSYEKKSLEIAEYYYSVGYEEFYSDDGALLILIDKDFKK